jgi:NADH dehydrogenase FAD-containing subunit
MQATGLKGKRLTGFVAWVLWRSVYLTKLGSWRNRLQVPMDWSRTLLFGRDTNYF